MAQKKHYKTVFISDVHLGNPKNLGYKLLNFLKSIETSQIIICGDLFDFWQLNTFGERGEDERKLTNYINKLSRNGTKIIYLQGNHDRTLRCKGDIQLENVTIMREMFYTTGKNKTYYVCHGDRFDKFNSSFYLIGRFCNFMYSLFMKIEYSIFKSHKSKTYLTVVEKLERRIRLHRFSEERYLNKFFDVAKDYKCDGVIFGHYHIPGYEAREGLEYFNTGARIGECSAVVEKNNGELELLYLDN